jgi:hypothetical protein
MSCPDDRRVHVDVASRAGGLPGVTGAARAGARVTVDPANAAGPRLVAYPTLERHPERTSGVPAGRALDPAARSGGL